MQYVVDDWLGHPNVHCPFCPFATVSDNGQELVDSHVAFAHPTELREALTAEMVVDAEAEQAAMNKTQLLAYASDELGIEGLTTRSTRAEIEAAIAAKQEESATETLVTGETTNGAPTAPEEE